MPFGQSFFISRIVGKVVEGVTGDPEMGKKARTITRIAIAIGTLDITGHVIDHLVDHATDAATDHVTDLAASHAADAAVDNHLHNASDVLFGGKPSSVRKVLIDRKGPHFD